MPRLLQAGLNGPVVITPENRPTLSSPIPSVPSKPAILASAQTTSPASQQPESHRTNLLSVFQGIDWSRPLESGNPLKLEKAQRDKADAFIKAATEIVAKSGIEILFRGETRARLGERLCLDSSAALSKVASGLFYFGDKGKHFWKEELRRRQEETRTKWDTVVGSINDLSLKSFDGLLHHIDSILKLDKSHCFRAENVELCRIIENKSERTDLTKRFDGLSQADKRWVRDLFIYIVHNFSRPDQNGTYLSSFLDSAASR